jgi:hypothetical protein
VRGLLLAALALAPLPAAAQTATPDPDLLLPALDGDPKKPPRFRKPASSRAPIGQPAPGKFTQKPSTAAPSRIGTTPLFGSPPAFGAGSTGFDSGGDPRRKSKAKAKAKTTGPAPAPVTTFAAPPVTPAPPKPAARASKPPPPEIHPAAAAARTGALLPPPPAPVPLSNPPAEVHPRTAATRQGAVLAPPPPVVTPVPLSPTAITLPPGQLSPAALPPGTPIAHRAAVVEADPFEAVGIRAGSFVLRPAIELIGGFDSNPSRLSGGRGAPYMVAAPELVARSDWSRHALNADIRGTWTQYGESFSPSLNRPSAEARIDGRIDATRDTRFDLQSRFIVATDDPGSPNLQAGLARLPINVTLGGIAGIAHRFNRLELSAKATVDRTTYQNSLLTDGSTDSNADRDYNQYATILRAGYDLTPGIRPFVEVTPSVRVHDQEFDRNGVQRDSTGISAKAGSTFEISRTLTGEFALGYLNRTYQDPTLPAISGTIADGALIWQASGLTNVKLTAVSTVDESVLVGVSGNFSRDLTLQVDHAFRRWLIGTLKAGYGRDDYVGSDRKDNRYFASAGLTYKLTRTVQVRGEVRQDWLRSSVVGTDYTATTFLVGLRLQR